MATTSNNLKGFYRQKKSAITPGGGISKSKRPSTKKNSPAASFGSGVTQPKTLLSHGNLDLQDDYDEQETKLRQFDMNMVYGPCVGMTRQERFDRAISLGLNPPKEIANFLRAEKVQKECLWDGLI